MFLGRMLEIVTAIRWHKNIEVSDEEVEFLTKKELITILLDADYQAQKAQTEESTVARERAENAKQEAKNTYAAWHEISAKLASFWHRFCVGKKQVEKEREELKKTARAWIEREAEGGKLWMELTRLENLATKLSKYTSFNGNWARLTPVGEFARKHLEVGLSGVPELSNIQYENYIQDLFVQAVSELSVNYSY